MSQSGFLQSVVERGSLSIGPPGDESETDDDIDATLVEYEAVYREEFPGSPPPFSISSGRWALRVFHRACQFLVYRDIDAETIAAVLEEPCPSAPDGPAAQAASRHYSVDLVFRFLPDLARLTKAASENDPLCSRLRQWGIEWPLSSVGMPDITPGDVSAICEHRGLLTVYVDRLIARQDTSRLNDPRVRSAVRASLGDFEDLSPSIAAALRGYDEGAAELSVPTQR